MTDDVRQTRDECRPAGYQQQDQGDSDERTK